MVSTVLGVEVRILGENLVSAMAADDQGADSI